MCRVQSFRRERGVTLFGPDAQCNANVTLRRHDVLTYPIIRGGISLTYLIVLLVYLFYSLPGCEVISSAAEHTVSHRSL